MIQLLCRLGLQSILLLQKVLKSADKVLNELATLIGKILLLPSGGELGGLMTASCFCANEVVLGNELVVEGLKDRKVYVLQLSRCIVPLRVLQQVE